MTDTYVPLKWISDNCHGDAAADDEKDVVDVDDDDDDDDDDRRWQDYVYIQCEYKSTKQKIKHLLREENKVKENKIS